MASTIAVLGVMVARSWARGPSGGALHPVLYVVVLALHAERTLAWWARPAWSLGRRRPVVLAAVGAVLVVIGCALTGRVTAAAILCVAAGALALSASIVVAVRHPVGVPRPEWPPGTEVIALLSRLELVEDGIRISRLARECGQSAAMTTVLVDRLAADTKVARSVWRRVFIHKRGRTWLADFRSALDAA